MKVLGASINKSNWIVSSHLPYFGDFPDSHTQTSPSLIDIEVVWSGKKFPAMKYWSSAFVKTGYNDRSGYQMSTRGWVQPLVTLVLCWASQSFAPSSPSSIRPHHSPTDLQSSKGCPREPKKVATWTVKREREIHLKNSLRELGIKSFINFSLKTTYYLLFIIY